jgi:hypothetical protein
MVLSLFPKRYRSLIYVQRSFIMIFSPQILALNITSYRYLLTTILILTLTIAKTIYITVKKSIIITIFVAVTINVYPNTSANYVMFLGNSEFNDVRTIPTNNVYLIYFFFLFWSIKANQT